MADDEVAAITENMVKQSPKMVRPASPIVDIYGDEEESYDVGGAINVSWRCSTKWEARLPEVTYLDLVTFLKFCWV